MPVPSHHPPLPSLELSAAPPIELRPYGDFVPWLAETRRSLAVSTYNSGKLALLSAGEQGLRATFWKLPRPMGLAVAGDQLAVALQRHVAIYRIGVGRAAAASPLRRVSLYDTGRIDAHDLAFDRRGLLLANTRLNCIARPSERVRFLRAWQPWFVARAMRRDCCHLNGLGVRNGRAAMATAFCERGEPSAWRDGNRFTSGVLIDVRRNRIVAGGLCMPHSPRWHDGRWWFCNSGAGTLATVDVWRGGAEAIAALPGFTRGLAFAGGQAVVGLSRIRQRHILDAPPVRGRWPRLQAGAAIVDLASGEVAGGVEFVRGGREVYDVALLPADGRAVETVE